MKKNPKSKSLITAEIIKVLPLKRDCYYLIFIPKSTGLSLDTLQTINDELAQDHYNFILVQVLDTQGIEAVERTHA